MFQNDLHICGSLFFGGGTALKVHHTIRESKVFFHFSFHPHVYGQFGPFCPEIAKKNSILGVGVTFPRLSSSKSEAIFQKPLQRAIRISFQIQDSIGGTRDIVKPSSAFDPFLVTGRGMFGDQICPKRRPHALKRRASVRN